MADRTLFRDRRGAGRVLAGLLERYRAAPTSSSSGCPGAGCRWPSRWRPRSARPSACSWSAGSGFPATGRWPWGRSPAAGPWSSTRTSSAASGSGRRPSSRWPEREGRELTRHEQAYRDGRPPPELAARTVVLVDDGLATGASMRAAVQALRQHRPGRIVVAVPAAPESACRELEAMVDAVDRATTDEEVRDLLRAAAAIRPGAAAASQGPSEVAAVRVEAVPAPDGVPDDDVVLFDLVGDARFVPIGEASHGTHELFTARARMTRRLIEELGFCAVAVEADWPDAHRVDRYVRGRGQDPTAEAGLRGFEQFLVRFAAAPGAAAVLRSPRLERGIGVVYRPQTERQSQYFMARVADQFDAVIHLDQTRALEPLERTAGWERGEVPETYPVGV